MDNEESGRRTEDDCGVVECDGKQTDGRLETMAHDLASRRKTLPDGSLPCMSKQ